MLAQLEEKFMATDLRMNKIRNEFDMASLNRFIGTKAEQTFVDSNFQL